MYIETQNGTILSVKSIESVSKPGFPSVVVSDLPDYYKNTPNQTYTIIAHTTSGQDVELYKSEGLYETKIAFDLVSSFLISGTEPFYQSKSNNCLYLAILEEVISEICEELSDELDKYEDKTVPWRRVSEKLPKDSGVNECKIGHLSWILAATENMIRCSDMYDGYTYTKEGIYINPIEGN